MSLYTSGKKKTKNIPCLFLVVSLRLQGIKNRTSKLSSAQNTVTLITKCFSDSFSNYLNVQTESIGINKRISLLKTGPMSYYSHSLYRV